MTEINYYDKVKKNVMLPQENIGIATSKGVVEYASK